MLFEISSSNGFLLTIQVQDLLYFHREGDVVFVHLVNNKVYQIERSLRYIEQKLDSPYFFRSHFSYLISLQHLVRVVKGDGFYLVMKNGQTIPVSIRQYKLLKERLKVLYPGP